MRTSLKIFIFVDIASNGKEALEAVKTRPYDIILMDSQMPEMDGSEATAKIRKLEAPLCKIPIIALTSDVAEGAEKRFLDAGMNDYLTKPADGDKVIETLNKFLAT